MGLCTTYLQGLFLFIAPSNSFPINTELLHVHLLAWLSYGLVPLLLKHLFSKSNSSTTFINSKTSTHSVKSHFYLYHPFLETHITLSLCWSSIPKGMLCEGNPHAYCGPHTELAEGKSKEKSLRIPLAAREYYILNAMTTLPWLSPWPWLLNIDSYNREPL